MEQATITRWRVSQLAPLILLMASSSIAAVAIGPELPAALEPLFISGVEAQKKGDLETAETAFRTVIEQGGKLAFVYNNLGAVYQQRKQHTRALEQFQQAIRLQPDYAAPRILAGASLLALERVSEAIQQLEQAVKLAPKERLARYQLAKSYDAASNLPGAIEQYRRLQELAPGDAEVTYCLGRSFMQLSAWCSREIERLQPGSARLFQTLANNYVYQGEKEMAIDALKQAVQADPKLPELHLAMAQLYLEQGQTTEALREIELELALVPQSLAARTLKEGIGRAASAPR